MDPLPHKHKYYIQMFTPVIFSYSPLHTGIPFPLWSWQSSWWNQLQQWLKALVPARTTLPQWTRGWDPVPSQRMQRMQKWPQCSNMTSIWAGPIRTEGKKKVSCWCFLSGNLDNCLQQVINFSINHNISRLRFEEKPTSRAKAIVIKMADPAIPSSPSMCRDLRPARSTTNSYTKK